MNKSHTNFTDRSFSDRSLTRAGILIGGSHQMPYDICFALQPQISVHDYKSLSALETPFSTAVMFAQLVTRLGNSSSMIILPSPLCLVFISVLLIS